MLSVAIIIYLTKSNLYKKLFYLVSYDPSLREAKGKNSRQEIVAETTEECCSATLFIQSSPCASSGCTAIVYFQFCHPWLFFSYLLLVILPFPSLTHPFAECYRYCFFSFCGNTKWSAPSLLPCVTIKPGT